VLAALSRLAVGLTTVVHPGYEFLMG
jgi:hypothetical protein